MKSCSHNVYMYMRAIMRVCVRLRVFVSSRVSIRMLCYLSATCLRTACMKSCSAPTSLSLSGSAKRRIVELLRSALLDFTGHICYMNTWTHSHPHPHPHSHTQTHTHTHTHIHTHTQTLEGGEVHSGLCCISPLFEARGALSHLQ
jgi:hypothetical protein